MKLSDYEARRWKINAELVEEFNTMFQVGDMVMLRKHLFSEYIPHKLRQKAYLMCGEPVARFENILGCFSIEKDFVIYEKIEG